VREDFFGPGAWDPLARALVDYQAGRRSAALRVHTDEGELDPMPVALFFRDRDDLRPVDREALGRVRGRVLDGGAGVGSLTLLLQSEEVFVTAVEVIPEAVEIMRARGVRDARAGRLEDLPDGETFDTVLLLMNGTSLAGTLAGFPLLLGALSRLVAPGGQVLVDSTDLTDPSQDAAVASSPAHGPAAAALPSGHEDDGDGVEAYPGELQYQLEYRGRRGAPFPQLFLDPATLRRMAAREGWEAEVVWQGEDGEYLACLTRSFRGPAPGP